MAEGLGHQGAPEQDQPIDTSSAAVPQPRASEAAALHRDRNETQRTARVDVRYSTEEKADIVAKARSLNIAAAHYVGVVVMAHLDGDLALPGQRTPLDDYVDELTTLRGEVAKIGHNINQIARKLNSGDLPHSGDTATLAQAERTLASVGTAVHHIAEATNQAVATKSHR
ncbi:plasmid mobilization relaxosome protein MobC [Streptomyces sp. NPDC091287]|uniref:plasmid mobilization relaxosome protein MobC n=1 Tax=Streptomyces sp. NPDC091287 TaxID=3365988 RepID=UPI0037F58A2D